MTSVLFALLLSQTSPAIRRTTPASDDPGMVVRQIGTVNVSCTNCSGGSGSGDGGPTLVSQGAGADGGAWQVYVTNQTQSSLVLDGGSLGFMRMPDGGPLETYITGGTISVTTSSAPPDGGIIGYLQMPDAGAQEVYVVNGGSSGWVPDGGFIGIVAQGQSRDGGTYWPVEAYVAFDGGWVSVANTVPVTGTFWQATQPISAASLPLPSGAATAANQTTLNTQTTKLNDGTDTALITGAGALLVDGSATTQPVSGTVTANAGSGTFTVGGTVAATQSGTWSVRTQDGSGNALASSTSTPAGTEQALIVRNIPSGTQAVSGTVTANAGTGNFATNVAQVNGNAVNTGSGAAGTGTQRVILATDQTSIPVTDNGSSITVDGTVAATQSGTWNITNVSGTVSLPTGASTSALQTTGNTSLNNIDTDLDVALSTRLADATFTGRFPTSASLADATANPSLTASASYLMGYNGTTWDRLRKSASGLLVDIANTSIAVTQSGTWNLNNISGTISLPTGAATEATLGTRLAESTFTGRFAAGAALTDNFANPTTTSTAAMNMLWDGATWDRAPGNSTDGMLVNLGANNDVTVTGTVTANAGTGNFTVVQSTASSLRTQTSAEGATGSAVPANAALSGFRDPSGNLRPGYATDADTSGGTIWTQGVSIVGASFGAVTPVGAETVPVNGFVGGLLVRQVAKTATNPASTSVSCTGTAGALPASALAYRTSLCVTNNGSNVVYLGPAGVTTANGFPLPVGAVYCDDVATQVLYCISAGGTEDVRVLEQ